MTSDEACLCAECGGDIKPGAKVFVATWADKAFCCKACAHMHLVNEDAEFRAALKIVMDQTSKSSAYLYRVGD